MEVIICQIFLHMLENITARQKSLQFHCDIASGIVDERTDDCIITGILPVADGFSLWLFLAVEEVIHHIPWTIDIRSTEVITVVPVFDLRCSFNHAGIWKKFLHIDLGKSKIFIQWRRWDCIRNKVVGSCKDTFLCDFQTAGNGGKTQGTVIFQCCTHERFHQFQHLGIITICAGFGKRYIIFIQKQNDGLLEMCLHHTHQEQNAGF